MPFKAVHGAIGIREKERHWFMKIGIKFLAGLVIGGVFTCHLSQNLNAQMPPIPPGGGGGGGYTNSYSSLAVNTNFLISLQGTNIVLNWRSATNKIFLLESRATLDSSPAWGELTNYYLSAANTNWTRFVHTNIIRTQPTIFYRLFDVTPVAKPDFFAVDQDSSANQLDILENDICPNDDAIIITNLIAAQHGGISYTPDASTFQYTPDSGFYGVDTFAYSITSKHGEISSNAVVTVFVNQSGNNPPSMPDIIITLQTNVHAATFNALTNATDPDSDTMTLFAVNAPSLGSVSNDASGNITYTRNLGLFGGDVFTYIVTDGKGGYGLGKVKISQVDSDGDGMPDEWEMANGLDPFNDDSMADPDNDGLPNLAEYVLETNPQVADNPLNLSGVPNGTVVSGFAQLPIYGLSATVQKPPITLYLNGVPAENSSLWQGPDGRWYVNWDTTFLTNGNYQVQLVCQVAPPSSPDSISNIFGTNKTVQVSNPIKFDSFTIKFNNFLLIYGELAVTNSTYDVYLSDESSNALVHATGRSAPNGQIALYWDLTDGNGNQISFGNIQAAFTIHPPANPNGVHPNISSSTSANHWFLKDSPNVNANVFAVAWGWDSYSGSLYNFRTEMMSDGVINILGNPSDFSSYSLLPANNVPYGGNAFRYDDELDKSVLVNLDHMPRNDDFSRSGNFFWFGHGDGDDIGGNMLKSAITSGDVTGDLQNLAYESKPKHPYNNKHPYRLTILNACQTYSPSWAGAFGVEFSANGSPYSSADYDAVGRSKRAFVGWTKKIGVPGGFDPGGLLNAEYGVAWGQMFSYWMAGYPLNYCMSQFSSTALNEESLSFINADSWSISGCYDLQRGD